MTVVVLIIVLATLDDDCRGTMAVATGSRHRPAVVVVVRSWRATAGGLTLLVGQVGQLCQSREGINIQ